MDVRYGSLTWEPFQLFVTDLQTGAFKAYRDYELGDRCGRRDAGAFTGAFTSRAAARSGRARGCVPGPDTLCLHGRFQVRVDWNDPAAGQGGPAGAKAVSRMAGAFDFGDDGHPDLTVKMVPVDRGRKFDVYYGTLTDREYAITITDTRTGAVKSYQNPAGTYCGGSEGGAF